MSESLKITAASQNAKRSRVFAKINVLLGREIAVIEHGTSVGKSLRELVYR